MIGRQPTSGFTIRVGTPKIDENWDKAVVAKRDAELPVLLTVDTTLLGSVNGGYSRICS